MRIPSPSGSTRGGHRDVPGFEERGRWRQPDEGAGGAVHITLALRPYPPPSPGGRGASTRNAYWQVGNLNDASRVFQLNEPVVFRYSLVYQNVQSSTGSTVIAL